MIRAEQQRIYLIERNKINDLREKFVIVGPTGNVGSVLLLYIVPCGWSVGHLCIIRYTSD